MVERAITRAPLGFPSTRSSIGLAGVQSNQPTISIKRQFYPTINPIGHAYASISNQERVPLDFLRRLSRTIPAQKAIARIVDGVLGMTWYISAPKEDREKPEAKKTALFIDKALRRPNRDEHNTYEKVVGALITEVLCLGVACIERQPGTDDTQAFWLWDANAANIHINPAWTPQTAGIVPRYYDMTVTPGGVAGIPIMDEHLFVVLRRTSSYEFIPPSALETAYSVINSWLGLSTFQSETTSHATQEFILDLGEVSEDQLIAFREYWEVDVQGKGRMPIIAGKGLMKTDKIGASDDGGLYHQYTEYLLKLIASCFGLSQRDFNITDHDNRATSGAAADSSFQDAVLPMALAVINHIEMEVVDFYYPGYTIKLTDTEPRTEREEADNAVQLFTNGIITKNEARQRVGDETVEDGDTFFDKSRPDGPSEESKTKEQLDQQKIKHGEVSLQERQQVIQQQAKMGQQEKEIAKPGKMKSFQLSKLTGRKRNYAAELLDINLPELLNLDPTDEP